MDRNSLIGLLLMGLIIFGFTYINRPLPKSWSANASSANRWRLRRLQRPLTPEL